MAESKETSTELATVRDTVESIWVAIVLAFVLRAFMIEAFVIPTGSMAPRLMGEHYQLMCPSCKYEFAFGHTRDYEGWRPDRPEDADAQCPTCRYPLADAMLYGDTYSGDRVLVLKYLYCFSEPEPWDVVVFKNPQDNSQNYIKRLIGLPGETIQIVHGDVFYRQSKDAP